MTQGPLARFSVSWSSDSRWIAYSRGLDNRQSAIFLFDTASGERHQVTTGFVDCSGPVFDEEGKYLYYLSDRSFEPSYSAFDPTWIYANPTNLVAVPLRKDVASPLAPRNDVEGADAGDGGRRRKRRRKAATPTRRPRRRATRRRRRNRFRSTSRDSRRGRSCCRPTRATTPIWPR